MEKRQIHIDEIFNTLENLNQETKLITNLPETEFEQTINTIKKYLDDMKNINKKKELYLDYLYPSLRLMRLKGNIYHLKRSEYLKRYRNNEIFDIKDENNRNKLSYCNNSEFTYNREYILTHLFMNIIQGKRECEIYIEENSNKEYDNYHDFITPMEENLDIMQLGDDSNIHDVKSFNNRLNFLFYTGVMLLNKFNKSLDQYMKTYDINPGFKHIDKNTNKIYEVEKIEDKFGIKRAFMKEDKEYKKNETPKIEVISIMELEKVSE